MHDAAQINEIRLSGKSSQSAHWNKIRKCPKPEIAYTHYSNL